ncbi:glycoside hydrolase family 28 protein [Petroclostridium xylanilyticum]|jgi:polygalacturonase|uniref:glycoside hydrolase family 28 protein n=1 Tax=Petroclostridium xylanilyticum TaxID=1792311 RepID=UPI000B9994D2|nr:glycoside hydrolase family 28 protein [Petroclostridium xylanilyticum]
MNTNKFSTVFNIAEFGAVADGVTICTKAFEAAVQTCVKAGGGTIYVPSGNFLTGSIRLESNINLCLEAGAILTFINDINEYPLVNSRWEGVQREVYASCIYGENIENVSITGYGTLDGQGEFWWKLHREKKNKYPRPKLISFHGCKKVLIEGLTLKNSPSWTINPICCENITVDKVTILNPADSPNTDGINPESCKNVHISNCHVDVGDDCITIKSGTEATSPRVPCENITVTNCTMVHGHGGVVIGSEMSGDVRNVVISNCVFEGTDRGIRIKSRRGRGGVVEDIRVTNIIMKNVICPFIMNLYYFCGPGGKEKYVWDKNPYPVTDETPAFRRIHFSNITARETGACAGFLYGLAEQPIEDITFDNISISMAENAQPGFPAMMAGIEPVKQKGFFVCNVKDVYFNNVTVSGHEGPAFEVIDSTNVEFNRCKSLNTKSESDMIVLKNVK